MGSHLVLICVLELSSILWAQADQAEWENLSKLRAGEKTQVLETSSTRVSGSFLSFSDADISVQAEAGPQTIQIQNISSIKRIRNNHRLRNTLLVAGAGAGVGAGIGAATFHPCPSTQSFCLQFGGRSLPTGIGAVAGLLGGAAVGALLPTHDTIYHVSSR